MHLFYQDRLGTNIGKAEKRVAFRQLGPGAIVIDNGFFLAGKYPHNKQLAGADAWVHTGTSYAESMSSIGDGAENAFKRHFY